MFFTKRNMEGKDTLDLADVALDVEGVPIAHSLEADLIVNTGAAPS